MALPRGVMGAVLGQVGADRPPIVRHVEGVWLCGAALSLQGTFMARDPRYRNGGNPTAALTQTESVLSRSARNCPDSRTSAMPQWLDIESFSYCCGHPAQNAFATSAS